MCVLSTIPSCSRSERPSIGGVRLNLTKAVEVIRQALSIYKTGYEVPIQHNVNVNDYDKIFNALVKATDYDARCASAPTTSGGQARAKGLALS